MKIQIRKGMFETNSSSVHALIITNERDKEKDCNKIRKEEALWEPYININYCLKKKEDKVLMLAGLFDGEQIPYGGMEDEYKIFIKVLKDNNEVELIEKIRKNRKEYRITRDEPYCTNYYSEGCLIDCNCCFYSKFNAYFKDEVGSLNFNEMKEDVGPLGLDEKEENRIIRKMVRENRKLLYNRLYDFIYGDGLIIPYDTM